MIFQTSPKGPSLPYKASAYTVPPPTSSTSPMLSDSPATLSTPYTSPPPPAPLHQVGEPLPLMPQFFSPSPLLQPTAAQFGPVNPATCAAVRYTAVPISPSAMFPYLTAGGGDPHKQPQALYCNQAPIEVSF